MKINSFADEFILPSKGAFYENKVEKVIVEQLDTEDESILTSPHFIQSGTVIDVLMKKRVKKHPDYEFIDPNKDMIYGDRLAVLIYMRIRSISPIYSITLLDENQKPFDYDFDLTTLKTKNPSVMPDEDGLFTFIAKNSFTDDKGTLIDVPIKFRMRTVADEQLINKNLAYTSEMENHYRKLRVEQQVIQVGDLTERSKMLPFLRGLHLKDFRELINFMDEVEPGFDLNVEVETPGGGSITTFLSIANPRFLYEGVF
jgi:hypothetical protein